MFNLPVVCKPRGLDTMFSCIGSLRCVAHRNQHTKTPKTLRSRVRWDSGDEFVVPVSFCVRRRRHVYMSDSVPRDGTRLQYLRPSARCPHVVRERQKHQHHYMMRDGQWSFLLSRKSICTYCVLVYTLPSHQGCFVCVDSKVIRFVFDVLG